MIYKRIILDVELPDNYNEERIDKALDNAIKNKDGKILNKYIYQDIDKNGEYIEGGQL
jgi:hypothetical protein